MLHGVLEGLDGAETDETTERLLEAALRQFEDFGLRRTTMEDVARRMGVSRVTIYRRIPGKDALIEAVVLREIRRFFAQLDEAIAAYDTLDDRLVEGFAFSLGYLRSHALFNRLLATEPDTFLPLLTTRGAPVVAAIRRLLGERLGHEVEEGRLPPHDVEIAGELLARLVLSFHLAPDTAANLDDLDDAREFARRYVAPGLRGAAQGA